MPPSSPDHPDERADLDACRALLRAGSKSFALASLLLPRRVRDPAAALYAFCRVADDAVDLAREPGAVDALYERLDRAYAGEPMGSPIDRALSRVVLAHGIPRSILASLIEGFSWDAEGRRYDTFESLTGYAARVAGTVGVMMTVLMGPRDEETLARACDLGVAMQLTNIARDVGEDARAGRVYLPLAWLDEAGVDVTALVASPRSSPGLARVTARLLGEAELLYARSERGIARLPRDARRSIRAARLFYADIGRVITRAGYDSVTRRAVVSAPRKIALLLRALFPLAGEREARDATPPLLATRYLVEAASSR